MSERIGFLGLGIMGSRMAANIRRAGFELTVWTHSPGKARRWASEHGAQAVETPAEVAAVSDIVVSIVVDGAQVASVLTGPDGVIESGREGLLCVDMSTISPRQTREIAAILGERGLRMIDAPVTGSSPRAENATLTIMVGGEEEDFRRSRPVLETMGELILHVGPLGHGEMIKLINNSLAAANAAAVAEALVLARSTGVDLDAVMRIAASGSGGSAMLDLKGEAMIDHDYTTLFKTDHLLKDVVLCLQEGLAAGVGFPAASHARDLLASTTGRGHGDDDFAAVIEAVEGLTGRRL